MNILSSIMGRAKSDQVEKEDRAERVDWYEGLRKSSAAPARRYARIVERDRQNTQDRFYRRQARVQQQDAKLREHRAVVVLAEIESREGVAPGRLRQQLIDEGKLWNKSGHTHQEILAAFGLDDDAIRDLFDSLQEAAA